MLSLILSVLWGGYRCFIDEETKSPCSWAGALLPVPISQFPSPMQNMGHSVWHHFSLCQEWMQILLPVSGCADALASASFTRDLPALSHVSNSHLATCVEKTRCSQPDNNKNMACISFWASIMYQTCIKLLMHIISFILCKYYYYLILQKRKINSCLYHTSHLVWHLPSFMLPQALGFPAVPKTGQMCSQLMIFTLAIPSARNSIPADLFSWLTPSHQSLTTLSKRACMCTHPIMHFFRILIFSVPIPFLKVS